MEKISTNISYYEAVKSNTAARKNIDNTPNEAQISNMKLVALYCFQPLREWYGKAIGISSFFRCILLNISVGGSTTSQHCAGESTGKEEAAIDIDADIYHNGITNAEIYYWLRDNVEYDQLIWEYGTKTEPDWVHVSFRKGANRKQNLRAYRKNGRTKYERLS